MSASSLLLPIASLYTAKSASKAYKRQAKIAYAQGYQDEAIARRQARALLGAQAAAIAQSGTGGYTGTNVGVVRESMISAELDALNIRYRGLMRGYDLRSQARSVMNDGLLTAGAQLLTGIERDKTNRKILSNG